MKKITSSLLLVLALAACSEQRPESMKEMLKTSYQKRSAVKAVKVEMKKADGASESTAPLIEEILYAELDENVKDFKFLLESKELQTAFNGEKLIQINHKDKVYGEIADKESAKRQLREYSGMIKNFLPFSKVEEYSKNVDTSKSYDDFVWESDTTVNGKDLYHISKKSTDESIGIDFYTNQLISKKSGFPMEMLQIVKNGDLLVQKENIYVKDVEVLDDVDDSKYDIEIPEGYKTYEEFYAEKQKKEEEESSDITPVNLKEGDIVPNFTLMDGDGNEVSLESLRGKPVVLDFWGTWCVWCVVAMPKMEAVYQEIGDKAHIYGISCREPEDANPKAFLKEKGVSYPTLVEGDKVAKLLSVGGYPTMLVIDKDGKLLHMESGYDKDLDKNLLKLLQDKL